MFEKIVKRLWPDVDYTAPANDATAFLIALEMVNRGWNFKIRNVGSKKLVYFNKGEGIFTASYEGIMDSILNAVDMALEGKTDETPAKPVEETLPAIPVIRKRGRPRKDAQPI